MPLFNPGTAQITFPIATNVTSTTVVPPTETTLATAKILVAANLNRKNLTLFNQSTGTVYVDYGRAPTATDCAFPLRPDGYWEIPGDCTVQVQGLWSVIGGTGVQVREFF